MKAWKIFSLIIVFFIVFPTVIIIEDRNILEAMYQNGQVSGTVASYNYSWLDDSTSVVFSNIGQYRFVGNYNFQIGANYTINYQRRPLRGNFITNMIIEGD